MSDSTQYPAPDSAIDDETHPHHPKHRRDDVPVDAEPETLQEFGDNPDTSLAG